MVHQGGELVETPELAEAAGRIQWAYDYHSQCKVRAGETVQPSGVGMG